MSGNAPEVIVTNFNPNFTGVSATAAAVTRHLEHGYAVGLCGKALPDCPAPFGRLEALRASRHPSKGRDCVVWHVRRNSEMQFALFARDILRLPVKIVFTSAAQRRHSAYPRWLISRMDAVIATTKAAASFVPNVRAVIPHGVDTDWFQPSEDRARAWQATGFPGRAGIATVGRVRPEKGTDRFVDAMVSALPGLPDVTALIIGKATPEFTAFEADLKARVKAAGLSHRIIFTGEMTAEQMRKIYPALSVLVAVPRYEGYGMTVLEAMAAEVPVVASDTGNFSELVEEGMSGHIVPGGDPVAVAAAVRRILTGDGKVASMGGAGRRSAVDRFSVVAEAAAIGGVYEALFTEAALRRSR